MLRSMREGAKSAPMKIFLVILAVGFALWGIGDVFRTVASNDSAVTVGNVEVSAIDAAREFDRARRNFLPNTNNNEAIASGLLSNVLAQLARRSLFVAEAQRMGLTVTRDMEKRQVASEPAFKDDLGQFSVIRFRDTLSRNGMEEGDYLALISHQLMQLQITDAINAGVTYPLAIAETLSRWRHEQRIIRIAEIPVDRSPIGTPDDQAIISWYGENGSLFDSPALRHGVVAVVSPDVFIDAATVNDDEITDFYEANVAAWQQEESREIHQMIFSDATAANTAISRIRSGETFAAIASDMLQLKAADIYLGSLRRDDLSPALADHVFAADINQVIGPVETPLGQHVLLVEKINAPEITSLESVREDIIEELKREKAIDLVYDRVTVLEDAISNGETVEDAAKQSGAALVRLDGMDQNGLDTDGNQLGGLAEDSEFRQDFWTAQINDVGTVVNAGEDSFYVARVDREEEARSRTLDEVRGRVIEVMISEMAIAAARTTAEEILAAGNIETAAKAAGAAFSEDVSLRRDGVGLDHNSSRLIAPKAFELAPGETGIAETGAEFIIVSVKSIIPASDKQIADEAILFREELANGARSSMVTSLLTGLEEDYKIDISSAPVRQLLIGVAN